MLNVILLDYILGIVVCINKMGGWYGDLIMSEVFERVIWMFMLEFVGDVMRFKVLEISDMIEKVVWFGGFFWINFEIFV